MRAAKEFGPAVHGRAVRLTRVVVAKSEPVAATWARRAPLAGRSRVEGLRDVWVRVWR
jgi:hypothetical protein